MEEREALVSALRQRLARGAPASVSDILREVTPEEGALTLRAMADDEIEEVLARLREEQPEESSAILALLDAHDVRRVLDHLRALDYDRGV